MILIDYLKLNTNKNVERFLDSNLNNAFFPSILLPTRVTRSTNTLIDNIHIKDKKCRRYSSNVIIDDISDHFPCILSIYFNQKIRKEEPLYVLKHRLNDNAIYIYIYIYIYIIYIYIYNIYIYIFIYSFSINNDLLHEN